MKGLIEKLGYECDVNTLMMTGKTRQIYYGGAVPMIDVFLDKLDYCHEVSFKDRLEFDRYSISLPTSLLQKLQIWEINDKDLKDIEYLFVTFELGDDDDHKINQDYVARALRGRLGLLVHGDAAQPGAREAALATRCLALTPPRCASASRRRADKLQAGVEAEPKTKKWQKRAKEGRVPRPGTTRASRTGEVRDSERDEQATRRENVRA